MAALHLMISGRVQGVGFRWSMCAAAIEHGARGWVRNRRDGRVEAVVDAAPAATAALLAWAQHGPRTARVDHVESRPATAVEMGMVGSGFEPLPDA